MTQILPGYTTVIKGMGLAPLSKDAEAKPSNAEGSDLQPSSEQAKDTVTDEGKKINGSAPTLQNRAGLLQALVELKQSAIPVATETYSEVFENINYSLAQQKHYASHYKNSEDKSDIEIQQQIQNIVNGTQKSFLDPFMTASQKMTDYYNAISTLRDTLSQYVKSKDNDKGDLLLKSNVYSKISDLFNDWREAALYPADSSGVSKAEAEDWCAKMGVGKIISATHGQYRVVIDETPLSDMLKVFAPYKSVTISEITLSEFKISQTVYNNLMSSVDTFLQKEQGKMNKIVNQLDYYNKLISQLQERLSEFSKQMADVALNFLRV